MKTMRSQGKVFTAHMILLSAALLLGVINCKDSHPLPKNYPLCDQEILGGRISEEIKNADGIIELYENVNGQFIDTLYFIKRPPSKINFAACDLPESFKKDGLQIKFSGKVYSSDEGFSLWLPIVLTKINLSK